MSENEAELWHAPVRQLANLVVQDLVWDTHTFAARLTRSSVATV